jgi:putative nucleotidyltransferase with HDIG domain
MEVSNAVLLVIGAPIIREPIEVALQAAGLEVLSADSAAKATLLLGERRIASVVIDLDLPAKQGWSLLSSIRNTESLAELPVIVLSATADKPSVMLAAKHKVAAFVLKSKFSLASFVEKLQQSCADHNQSRAVAPAPVAPAEPAQTKPSDQPASASPAGDEPAASAVPNAPTQEHAPRRIPGDPAAALKAIKPILSRSELTECIDKCEQLKAFSPTVTQLMKITSSQECSIQRVVKVAGQDHAIALKLLKLANSVAYGRGDPVDALKTAVMRIGLDKIRQAVMNIGLVESFDSGPGAVNLPHFWEHAIGCAVIAGELAHTVAEVDPEAAFTAGLLHDVGRIVLAEQLGDRYAGVLSLARELRLPLEQVESRMILINHADVMDRLLHTWKFSKHLINPIVLHHLSAGGIRQACPREVAPIATLALANRLAHAMLLGSSGNDTVYPTEDLCQALRIDGATIAAVCESAPSQAADMKLSLLSSGQAGAWKSYKDEVVAALQVPARVLFCSANPPLDAHRILCQTVAGTTTDEGLEAPNIGVVHIASARDIVLVSTRYATLEQQAGCGKLPLLVISPLGQLNVEKGLAAGRNVRQLASPLNVHEFIEALNQLAGAAATPTRLAA